MNIRNYLTKFLHKDSIKTLFLIDILYMKDINAIYDFKNGDFVIKQLNHLLNNKIKQQLKKHIKKNVNISITNSHADVFELFIYNDLELKEIIQLKNIIFENIINHQFKLYNFESKINIDVTIGCSKSNDNQIKIYAEKALHNAKLDCIHYSYYDSYLFKNESIGENILDILDHNIANNLVEPYFQSIMDNTNNEIIKYEALMRVFDKNGNVVLPNIFISKAKKCRLYNKLMEILIEKVIDYIMKYKINISINLDYTDILNPQFRRTIISKIKKYHIGHYLTIEILESEKIMNFDIVSDFINDLKNINVQIAIDDFGTGFSNYENILKLNVDFLKIDGSLIKKIDEEIYFNLIKSIVLFCKQQNIKIVAEFVSDLKILRFVKSIGIDYSQGYYIGKPEPIDKIIGDINEK